MRFKRLHSLTGPMALALGLAATGLCTDRLAHAQSTAPAATPSPVPVEAFFATPSMGRPQLSPSGRYVSVLRPIANGRLGLMVLDLQRPGQLQLVAGYSNADVTGVHWSGDEFLLYSLTDETAAAREVDFAPGLFSVARQGGEPRELIRHSSIRDAERELQRRLDKRLSPGHVLLFVPQDNSREVVLGERKPLPGGGSWLEPFRLHIETGRVRSFAGELPNKAWRWLFDGQGEPRVAVTGGEGRIQVHWRAPGGTVWQQILDSPRVNQPWSPHSVDDAGALYVVHAQEPGGIQILSKYDFARQGPEPNATVHTPGFDFVGQRVSEGGNTLGFRFINDNELTVWLDPTLQAIQAKVDQLLPGRANRIHCRQCASDQRVVLVDSHADRDPGTYFVWLGQGQPLQALGRLRMGIEPLRMARQQFNRFTARDGLEIPIWLTLPPQPAGQEPPPAVVLVHDGPWVRGGSWSWDAMAQFLASRGYAVIEPEFRGSAGYGQAHLRAGWKQWGQAMQDDLADALRWAANQGLADGRRACIMGTGYGGYAALMGLARDPDLYRCGVAASAITDLTRYVQGSWWWRDNLSDEARHFELRTMVGNPDQPTDAVMLSAHSPVNLADRIQAPVLLAHGEGNRRVPIVHATDMRRALQAAGHEPEWLVFEREGHLWAKPVNDIAWALKVEAFLGKNLGLKAQ